MAQLSDKCVDLILTDPPYAGAGMKYDMYDDTDKEKTTQLVLDFLKEAKRIGKIVIFPSGKYDTEIKLFQTDPPNWRLCWHKGSTPNVSKVGFNDWEMMMVYGEKICVYTHDHFTVHNTEKRGNYGHPCPKPLKWAQWLINKFCPVNGIVFDPFLGSGTVMVAAETLNRRWFGCDLSPAYCDEARRRIDKERAQLKLFKEEADAKEAI